MDRVRSVFSGEGGREGGGEGGMYCSCAQQMLRIIRYLRRALLLVHGFRRLSFFAILKDAGSILLIKINGTV